MNQVRIEIQRYGAWQVVAVYSIQQVPRIGEYVSCDGNITTNGQHISVYGHVKMVRHEIDLHNQTITIQVE